MNSYEDKALKEYFQWKKKNIKNPSILDKLTKGVQKKTSQIIPENIHKIITGTIKNITMAVLTGSEFLTNNKVGNLSLQEREKLAKEKQEFYRGSAAISGVGTGAGGLVLGLCDFPILISIKFKYLFEIAQIYGFDTEDYYERVYILYVFQLAFSSQQNKNRVFDIMNNWDEYKIQIPKDMNDYEWQNFQQEYRDYIDLAKMFQLVPGIGAVVGGVANYRLLNELSKCAVNMYRLRYFKKTT